MNQPSLFNRFARAILKVTSVNQGFILGLVLSGGGYIYYLDQGFSFYVAMAWLCAFVLAFLVVILSILMLLTDERRAWPITMIATSLLYMGLMAYLYIIYQLPLFANTPP